MDQEIQTPQRLDDVRASCHDPEVQAVCYDVFGAVDDQIVKGRGFHTLFLQVTAWD